jgi:hypothetical protein
MQWPVTCNVKPYDILKLKSRGKICVLRHGGTLFEVLSSSSLLYLLFLFICLLQCLWTSRSPQHNSHSSSVCCNAIVLHRCDTATHGDVTCCAVMSLRTVTVVQLFSSGICVAARHFSFAADRGSKQKYQLPPISVPEIVAYFSLRNCLFVTNRL